MCLRPLTALFAATLVATTPAQDHSTDRSKHLSDREVTLSIANQSEGELEVFWIDFDGRPRSYGRIPTGATVEMSSYPGHLWTVRSGDRVLARYRTEDRRRQLLTVRGRARPPGRPERRPTREKGESGTEPEEASGGGDFVGTGTGSELSPAEARDLVAFHNRARVEVGVGEISWSVELAHYAQQWADHLARQSVFEHRPAQQRRYGENLAGGSASSYSVIDAARQWYAEKPLYRPPGAPFSVQLMPAGHYTQMVWKDTRRIGAGKAVCRSGRFRGWVFIVCNYDPAGNLVGQPAY